MFMLITTARPWCDSHSTNISACGMWGAKAEVQISWSEFHIHIHLDYVRVEFLSCIKKNVYVN